MWQGVYPCILLQRGPHFKILKKGNEHTPIGIRNGELKTGVLQDIPCVYEKVFSWIKVSLTTMMNTKRLRGFF